SKSIGPMIDLVFISQFIGISGVTVMGYVAPLIILLSFIGSSVSNGARVKTAPSLGSGNLTEANQIFSNAVILGGVISISAALLIAIFSGGVCFVLGVREANIFIMTRQYIYGYIIGLPFLTLARILAPYLELEGQYKRVVTSSFMMTFIDIVADAFVIFVLKGGMFEIGLATSLGYIVSFLIESSFFFNKKSSSSFSLSIKGVDPEICLDMLKLGSPSGFFKGSNALGGMLINNLLTSFNMPYLVAAYGVFSQITVYLRAAWSSSAENLLTFSGIFIGEEDKASLKEVQKLALTHAFICSSILAVLLFIFAEPVAKIFMKSSDPAALIMAVECIQISSLSLPFHTIVENFCLYIIAVKRISFCNFYNFLSECGDLVPITFLLLNFIGYRGAWISKIINMLILSFIAILYIYMNKEAENFRDKMLLLPKSFGISPENEISVIAHSEKEIEDLSRVAIAFAIEHEADKKRARTFGLITEELAGFFAEHGLKDGKPHTINTRLVAKDEELIIRMRDDCKPFNLKEYYNLLNTRTENEAGLMIIMKMSKEVIYTPTFGANNLIIKL
ncbi:MAG: hypothetical protein IJR94_05590, partial [Synergistaceae bacterium]|nr:hypothetical protein [Synergistaceae bacterium]